MFKSRDVSGIAFWLGAMLVCGVIVSGVNGNDPIGSHVPDSVAKDLMGGADCNWSHTWNHDNPSYCQGGECNKLRPNSSTQGNGNEGVDSSKSCGSSVGCSTYTGQKECAA